MLTVCNSNDFAESLLYWSLTPAVCDQEELVDYMEGLEYGTLEFAEGESPSYQAHGTACFSSCSSQLL